MLRISIGDVQESLRNVKQIPYWDITKQKTDTRDAKKKSSIDSYLNNLWSSRRVQEKKETQRFPISRLILQGLLKDHTNKK